MEDLFRPKREQEYAQWANYNPATTQPIRVQRRRHGGQDTTVLLIGCDFGIAPTAEISNLRQARWLNVLRPKLRELGRRDRVRNLLSIAANSLAFAGHELHAASVSADDTSITDRAACNIAGQIVDDVTCKTLTGRWWLDVGDPLLIAKRVFEPGPIHIVF